MAGFPRDGSLRALSRSCAALAVQMLHYHGSAVTLEPDPLPPPPPLMVTAQNLPPRAAAANAYPEWRILGPFWRNWDERRQSNSALGEHGCPTLPAALYMSHVQSGFDTEFLRTQGLGLDTPLPDSHPPHQEWRRFASDDRLPLHSLAPRPGPCCYYAIAEFDSHDCRKLWLMVGTTGPVEIWLNGQLLERSETHQPLTPNTYGLAIGTRLGSNRVVLKLAKTSQPLEACLALKVHSGRHWHQCFFDTSLSWRRTGLAS